MERQHETIKADLSATLGSVCPGRRFADLEGIWLFCSRKVIKPCEHHLSQWIWAHGQHCDHIDRAEDWRERGVWTGLIIHVHHTAGQSGLNRESQLSQSIHLRASGLNTDITSQDSDQLQLSDNPRVMHSNMEFLRKQREKILKWQKRYDCIDGNSTKMLS